MLENKPCTPIEIGISTNNENRTDKPRPQTACSLWGQLLYEKHPEISQIILAYYYPKSFFKNELLRHNTDDLKKHEYFTYGVSPPPTIQPSVSYRPLLCSMSSIVGTKEAETTQFPLMRMRGQTDSNLELQNPKSFIHLDFACDISGYNLDIIPDKLSSQPHDWYLLQSTASYHAIIDSLIDPRDLPLHWSNLLVNFSQQSSSTYVKKYGAEISDSLKSNYHSRLGLRMGAIMVFVKALQSLTKEYDNITSMGNDTYIDWFHVYYSLKNLLDYYQGKSPGTGYLRISSKGDKPQPILAAQRISGRIEIHDINPSYFSMQPKLL